MVVIVGVFVIDFLSAEQIKDVSAKRNVIAIAIENPDFPLSFLHFSLYFALISLFIWTIHTHKRKTKFDQDNLCLFQLKAIKNTDRNFDFHANFLSGTYFVHMLRLFACLPAYPLLARSLACLLTQCRKCIAILLVQPQCLIRNTFLFFIRCVFDSSTIFHIHHPFIFLYVVHVICQRQANLFTFGLMFASILDLPGNTCRNVTVG